MENKVEVFNNVSFGTLRVKAIGNDIFFRYLDVLECLDLTSNPSVVKKRLTESGFLGEIEKGEDGIGRPVSYISEPNFYRCVMQSKKPEAERFQDWVVEEVLPSIRKHGAYMTKEKIAEVYSDPRKLAELLIELADERDLRIAAQKELDVAKPKAEYYDKILDSKDLLKLIGFEAYEVVRRFIQKLNPYQRYIVGYESCSAEISRNFFEELDISARICSILKDNPWIEELSKDVQEFGKELEIVFGGNDLKILHLTIVRSHFGHLLLNEYKDLSNSIRAILEVNDCNPNGYYKTLPISENSQIIVLTILSKLLKEKYNIKTNK